MKGLLTEAPHTDEPVIGEVLPFPVNLLHEHGHDAAGKTFFLALELYPYSVVLTIEDDDFWTDLDLEPEQAKALHDALGVALYGR